MRREGRNAPAALYARVPFCLRKSHARPRVQQAPGLPCALYFEEGQTKMQTSGDLRRENAKARSAVIACAGAVARMSAATSGDHSNTAPDIASLIRATSNKLDCFAALAMTRRAGVAPCPHREEAAKGRGHQRGNQDCPRNRLGKPERTECRIFAVQQGRQRGPC